MLCPFTLENWPARRSRIVPAVEPLIDYDKDGPGDYYQVPKKTGKDFLTEPYTYNVGGKDTLMTSFMVPLMYPRPNMSGA